jgi:hypothetical protein
MNKTDLIEYIKTHCLKENNRLSNHWTKKLNPHTIEDIIQFTNFLTNNPPIQVRIYALLDGLTQQPICKQCGIDLKYQSRKGIKCFRFNELCTSDKRKITNQKIYGGHPSQNTRIKQKKKESALKKYNVDNVFKSNIIKEKIKQTNDNRYGGHPSTNTTVKEKIKQTNKERYGGHPLTNETIKRKMKNTNINRYGCHPSQDNNVKYKIKYSNIKTKYNNKDDILLLLQDVEYMYSEYILKEKTLDEIANDLGVSSRTIVNYLTQYGIDRRKNYSYSPSEIKWLESEEKKNNISILHAGNGNQYKIQGTNFRVDGYCEETNTIYEFYGDYFHGNPLVFDQNKQFSSNLTFGDLYTRTMKREQIIKDLGYNIITMWESDFNNTYE